MIKAAFASGRKGELGYHQGLPWGKPLKTDMEAFKDFTNNCILVMGHNTFKSLPTKLRGLPHLVVTDDHSIAAKDGSAASGWITPGIDIKEMLVSLYQYSRDADYCFIGGAKLLEDVAPFCEEILHTEVWNGVYPDMTLVHDVSINLKYMFKGISRKGSKIIAVADERAYSLQTTIYKGKLHE